jgi:hypothetical protein
MGSVVRRISPLRTSARDAVQSPAPAAQRSAVRPRYQPWSDERRRATRRSIDSNGAAHCVGPPARGIGRRAVRRQLLLDDDPRTSGRVRQGRVPLPHGNAIVIMRPVAHADGSLSVVSAGRRFGDPGFYFTVHSGDVVWARYVASLKESIHVYAAENDLVRADHILTLWGATFLRLHYRLRPREQGSSPKCSES